ncbi:MAG: hypothetical protein D6732_07150 [Methanobacteriota archaeon]|nr:MAG: hypothetical protein D6732_07150 [Euryarchaeota archaeon]
MFFGSWVASFLLDLVGGVSYVNTATAENRDLRLNFLRLLMVIELAQFVSLLFLAVLERRLSPVAITILTLLWTTISTPLELIDTFWSDGTTIGNFFAEWQFAGILIAKGLETESSENVKLLNQAVNRGTMLKEIVGYEMYLKNPERNPSQKTIERASDVNSVRRRKYDGETFVIGLIGYHLLLTIAYANLFQILKDKWM